MRTSLIIVGCLLATGCATQQRQVAAPQLYYTPQTDSDAVALACDPAIIRNEPALYLDRQPRELSAFAGYDQSTVTYSYLRQDDYYSYDHGNADREAVTERLGVSTR